VQWSVDPDVRSGLLSDIYLYVAGSSFIKQRNDMIARRANVDPVPNQEGEVPETQTIKFEKGESIVVGGFEMNFLNYSMEDTTKLPANTNIGVRAQIQITHIASSQQFLIEPLFALFNDEDGSTFVFSPPVELPGYDLSFSFSKVYPETGEIDLSINGLDEEYQSEWILVVAEQKPFISVVWFGTFLLMIGFSVSIFRHWGREKKK
jgi:cytochrome c-type biogenesis protein CcmF